MKKIINFIKQDIWFIISLIIIVVLFNIKLPYYIDVSGGTIDISNRITTENRNNKINGSLNMLYVTEYEATIPTYLLSYLFKDWKVEKVSDVQVNNEDMEEIYERNRIMLDNSISNATYVAYTSANKNIEVKDKISYVIATTKDNGIKIGDIITKVNDKEINSTSEIKEIISNQEVGNTIKLTVKRNNKEKEINVKVSEEKGQKIIGVVIMTNYKYNLDPEINIKFKKSESGSSGGLMMALSIYSVIADDDIVKGRNIAGTGTIDLEGNVGKIDGIKYKLMGAVKNKMDVVLVPEGNYEEALEVKKEKKYDIEIVSIKTFNDAIEYLKNK